MSAYPREYAPRQHEESLLYCVIAQELETFLARQHERDHPVPSFVENEFRSFVSKAVVSHEFMFGS